MQFTLIFRFHEVCYHAYYYVHIHFIQSNKLRRSKWSLGNFRGVKWNCFFFGGKGRCCSLFWAGGGEGVDIAYQVVWKGLLTPSWHFEIRDLTDTLFAWVWVFKKKWSSQNRPLIWKNCVTTCMLKIRTFQQFLFTNMQGCSYFIIKVHYFLHPDTSSLVQ